MKTVTIFNNAVDATDRNTWVVDDVCAFLASRFPSFPDTAKIYHEQIAASNDVTPHCEADIERLQSLDGNFFAVIWPEDPISIAVVVAIAVAAVSIGLSFLLRPTIKPTNQGSPNNELMDRQNKARPNSRIPDIYGTVRSTPDLLMLPYKVFIDNQEVEVMYGCIGRGNYNILDCMDDQTPVGEIAGEYVAVYPPNNSPLSAAPAPQQTFGIAPSVVPPVACVSQSNAVNGQTCRPPNAGRLETNNNVAFTAGGLILSNSSDLDFTDYFVASTEDVPSYLTIFTNDDGVNASDPAENVHSVGLAGTYQILSVSASQITLSNPSAVNSNWDVLSTFAGQTSTYYHTFAITSDTSTALGPYILNVANLTEVWANFVAENGLYYVNSSGNQHPITVTIKMTAQSVDSALNPIGDPISGTVNITGSSIDTTICGATLKLKLPQPGPCQITVERVTPIQVYHSNRAQVETVQWRDLYAVAAVQFPQSDGTTSTTGDFGNVTTVLAITAQTQDALSIKERKLNLLVTRGLPKFIPAGSSIDGSQGGQATGSFKMFSSASLGWQQWCGAKYSNFAVPTLPSDAVITAIYPVAKASYNFTSGNGAELLMNFGDQPLETRSDSFSVWGFTPSTFMSETVGVKGGSYSVGTDLASIVANNWFLVELFQTANRGGMTDDLEIEFLGLAIYYTSATQSDPNLYPIDAPFPVPEGQSVAWAMPQTATLAAITDGVNSTNISQTASAYSAPTGTIQQTSGFDNNTLLATNNAADILCAMALDPFIGRRTIEELDIDGIYAVADSAYMGNGRKDGEIATYFGTFLMTEFCYTFDDAAQSFEEMVAMLAQAINCTAYRSARTLSLSFEKQTSDSTLIFNHRNKLPNSETRVASFGMLNDNDSVYYDYIDPNAPNFPNMDMHQTLYFPPSQSGVVPKRVKSAGVRNKVQAWINGWRLYQKIVYGAIQTEFDATQEANLCILNDRILVADNTRTGTQDGEVIAVDGLTVTASQKLNFVEGQTYTAFFQLYDETVQSIAVTPGPNSNQMVLAAAPALPLVSDPGKWARTTYVLVSDQTTRRPLPFLVTNKEPQDNNTYHLTAINYSDLYYAHDTDFQTAVILAPTVGYGPQGYTGSGLGKADGTTEPGSGTGYDGTSYTGSDLDNSNNPAPPVDTAPSSGDTSTTLILVNGE
jgi:hypothetical protein